MMSDELFMFRVIFYLLVANLFMTGLVALYIQRTRKQIERLAKNILNQNYGRMAQGGSVVGMAKYPPQ